MKGFQGVEVVCVPRRIFLEAHAHLRRVGEEGFEGFALIAGKPNGTAFEATDLVVPQQTGMRMEEEGVCVRVEADELHRLNVWLYGNKKTLIAQIHSHPTEAYHSETDDTYPIVTTVGGFSLVAPDFASRPFSLADYAVYRLHPDDGWVELEPAAVAKTFQIED